MLIRSTDDGAESDSSVSSGPPIDPEDPMAEYLMSKRKEEKALKKSKRSKASKGKRKDETPEERRARKARKKEKKAKKLVGKSEVMRGVEDLLASLGGGRDRDDGPHRRERTRSPSHTPVRSSRSPVRDRGTRSRSHRSRSRSPRDYEMRGPSRPYERDGRDLDGPSGRNSRSRRGGRDYD
jgi:RNA-binding motif protein, X-linked 2